MDNEKPFKCPKCTQCFATSDHLAVHQRMHVEENRNLLVKMPASSSEHVNTQTPTPTRFLKTGDVEGSVLFEDINPFDQAFASKRNASATAENASVISSTVEEGRARQKDLSRISTEISTNSVRRQPDGEPSSKRRANDEAEVSSSTVENNLREIDFKTLEKTHGSTVSHDQISSTSISGKQPTEVPVSLLCIEKSASSCEQISSPSINVSSCSSMAPSSVSPTAAAESVLSSSNENPETQTSLQTLLNQIQKQTNTADTSAKAIPVSSSGTQSQEALREQLKSLIKSGQIKIKFTSDPSSPKVQATIVGNIAKKTVTPRPPTRPTLIPNTTQSELLLKTDHTSQLPQTQQSSGIISTLTSPKIQLPQKLVPTPMNAIPIKPKLSISKPIPIAPKGQLPEGNSTSDTSKSVHPSPLSVLSTSAPIVSTNSWSVAANSINRHSFTKQKLKHVIQQNATGGNETISSISNGHFSMVTSSSAQGKYKDIMLEHEQGLDMESDEYEDYGNGRKHKIRINDDSTPEEKRQRFLERNRAAAARCRQKRKIWVNQLESKSDDLLSTNSLLMNEINALRSEVAQLKALLLAHKDCPVTLEQKALLGQMTPGSYVAAVSDGQIIAIHQVPNGNGLQSDPSSSPPASAEEVASSALTDMAARATLELGNSVSQAPVSVQSAESGSCSASSTVISA